MADQHVDAKQAIPCISSRRFQLKHGEAIVDAPIRPGSSFLTMFHSSQEITMQDIQQICDQIKYHHRQRNYAMEQRKRADLALGSFLRIVLGWNKDLPKAESDAIKKTVKAIIETGERVVKNEAKAPDKQKPVEGLDAPAYVEFHDLIVSSIKAREPFDALEKENTKRMEKLAEQLPVWSAWAKDVRGFGARSLAVIIGEAGNLSKYPKKGHLWKRMGVAVLDGVRQGGLKKTAAKEDWIAHGYNKERRSRMFVIGDCLVKSGGHYREIYLARKEYERQMAEGLGLIVAPAAKIPAKRKDEFMSEGHIHRRAQRYMEKKLLRDLRSEWNRCEAIQELSEMTKTMMPSAEPIGQADRVRPAIIANNPLSPVQHKTPEHMV